MRGVNLLAIAAGSDGQANGTFLTGRGDVVAVDFVTPLAVTDEFSTITLSIGGQQVLQNSMPSEFKWNAYPSTYKRIRGRFGENQNFQVFAVNASVAVLNLAFVQYYENHFDAGRVARLLADESLQTKRITFSSQAASGAVVTFQSIVPLNRGKIFAIQPFISHAAFDNPSNFVGGALSISVNGVQIIERVPALQILNDGSRNNFFPIDIEAGATISCELNATGSAAALVGGFILYFAPDDAKC